MTPIWQEKTSRDRTTLRKWEKVFSSSGRIHPLSPPPPSWVQGFSKMQAGSSSAHTCSFNQLPLCGQNFGDCIFVVVARRCSWTKRIAPGQPYPIHRKSSWCSHLPQEPSCDSGWRSKNLLFKDSNSSFFFFLTPLISKQLSQIQPWTKLYRQMCQDTSFPLVHLFSAARCLSTLPATCPVTPFWLASTILSKVLADNDLMHSFKNCLLRTHYVQRWRFHPS